jgi:hypothetical protein
VRGIKKMFKKGTKNEPRDVLGNSVSSAMATVTSSQLQNVFVSRLIMKNWK